MKPIPILVIILFLVFLSGCLEPTRNELNFCFSLASKSYTNIPYCLSEDACYKEASNLFESDNLTYTQQGKLYTLTNYLARSWYFFNLGKLESNKISEYCKTEELGNLPGSVAQARFYFDSAFANLDLAMKESFEIISQENSILKKEEVELLKEEEIYSVFVEMQQILSELSEGETNSGTYVSYYFSRVKEFERATKNRDFPEIVEKKPFWLSIYEFVGTKTIDNSNKKVVNIPFLGEIFQNSITQIQMRLDYENSVAGLMDFPIHELMKLYSDTAGSKDSTMHRFSTLITKTNNAHKNLEKNRAALWEETTIKQKSCENLYLKSSFVNEFPLILERVSGLKNTNTFIEELNNQKNKLISLKELVSKQQISQGMELSSLKDILKTLTLLERELINSGESVEETMINYCDKKAEETISQEKTFENTDLLVIWNNIQFYAKKVLDEKEHKFVYCEKLLNEQDNLNVAENDYDKFISNKMDLTADCFNELEELFKYTQLNELKLMFENLKKTEVKEDVLFFEASCQSILKQVKNELNTDELLLSILKDYEYILSLKSKAKLFCLEDKKYAELCNKLNNFEEEYSKYFKSKKINYSQVLPIKVELYELMKTKSIQFKKDFENHLILFISDKTQIIVLGKEVPETNTMFESKNRFLIVNQVEPINSEVILGFEVGAKKVLEKDQPIKEVILELGKVVLTNIPLGETKFDYIVETHIKTSEETTIVSSSNVRSIIQRKITLDSEKIFPSLLIKTLKPKNTTTTIVILEGKETIFSDEEQISFLGKNVSKNTTISLFFYVSDLILLKKDYLATAPTGTNTNKIKYLINAKSNFEKQLKSTLLIPLENNEYLEEIEIFDQTGIKQKIILQNNNVLIENQDFFPFEEKKYFMNIYTKNLRSYYNAVLETLREKLYFFGEISTAETATRLMNTEYLKNTQTEIEGFIKNAEKLIKEHENKLEKEKALNISKITLEQKINELLNIVTELEKNEFYQEAEKLMKEINYSKKVLEEENVSEINLALEKLLKYSFEPNELFISKIDDLWKEVQQIETNDSHLLLLKEDFFTKKQFLDQFISDPVESKKLFEELNELYLEIKEFQIKIETSNFETEQNNINKLNIVFENIENKLVFLETQLSVNENELIYAKFIHPITQARLKKIRLEISKLKTSESSISEKLSTANRFLIELDDAINSIKLQTISLFNELIDKNTNFEVLEKGKQLIDSNQYTSALILLSTEGKIQNTFSMQLLSFIPIVLVALIAIVLKLKMQQSKNIKQEEQKDLLESWEN